MKGNILIIDGMSDNLHLLSNTLIQQGYKVRCILDGVRALQAAQVAPPDLILLDLMVPQMNGYQICQRLKADEPTREIPVIFMSVRNEAGNKVNVFAAGGVDYITKPFQVEEVITRVENQLTIKRLQKQLLEQELQLTQLKQLNEDLKNSNRELEQFTSIVSHDLQQPLVTINSFAQLLAYYYQDKLDTKADQYITRILTGATQMRQMIEDLLTYGRIERQALNLKVLDCKAVLKIVLANLQKAIEESKAVITYDSLPIISGDRTQLIQLFQNLISNAIKYRRFDVPPQIKVSAELHKDEWLFSVHDNGIGIAPEHCERIFELHHRLHTEQEYPGTGMGLAISRKIVERYGGRIWVESQLDRGTTVYFYLPSRGTWDK